jgi:hypothetical protein
MEQINRWCWRDGELQFAQFMKLTSTAKQEHVVFLLSLPKETLGTNDQYILRFYAPAPVTKNNYFTLED